MKDPDKYQKWLEWNEEDQLYVGKCPDRITGIHGDDPVGLYADLWQVFQDVIDHFYAEGRPLSEPRVPP